MFIGLAPQENRRNGKTIQNSSNGYYLTGDIICTLSARYACTAASFRHQYHDVADDVIESLFVQFLNVFYVSYCPVETFDLITKHASTH